MDWETEYNTLLNAIKKHFEYKKQHHKCLKIDIELYNAAKLEFNIEDINMHYKHKKKD